ncbi:hypothetical protein Goklo_007434 [Gossypium klotzschianum]|uniref:Transthyretin/hydroxyisourate hydrolase domain-containing protein n=1 Tax=Gossypium klotzschianum TaxID=34286 RepID=A0A7J8W318_9ROSI|nr:hypothetical protein [Gossypium klotzschianum]
MKLVELRLSKLISAKTKTVSMVECPAGGIDLRLEMSKGGERGPSVGEIDIGKYNHGGFFLYVSIVFEIKETQKWEHFHVPLLLSPFSITAYRGS